LSKASEIKENKSLKEFQVVADAQSIK